MPFRQIYGSRPALVYYQRSKWNSEEILVKHEFPLSLVAQLRLEPSKQFEIEPAAKPRSLEITRADRF
jgi:hypothetical protein